MLLDQIKQSLATRREAGLYRDRSVSSQSFQLNFSRNDYLSLASDPGLQAAYQRGYAKFPVGSSGSPVTAGYHPEHQALERAFSEALSVDDALYFTSGYAANLSLMALLAHLDVQLYIDKASHASVYDGMALTGSKAHRYRHGDVDDLRLKFKRNTPAVILTESLFSMSGQIAPLLALADMGLDLLVDEAHAFGVMGPEGLGLVVALGLTQDTVPLRVLPLGKAFAGSGALIVGQGDWIQLLLQCARPYIYSTAPSPAQAYGVLSTLDVVRGADEKRSKLADLIRYFRAELSSTGLNWRDSHSAIQQLQSGCPHRALLIAEHLKQHSILCVPIRQPTVTRQETGLRIILNADHQPEDIDVLLTCLRDFK